MKFLLATTDPQKLPITILSRCLQFHLKSLDQTQIAKQLEWVLDQEGQPFEPRALLALAKAADGSMRDALSLTDQALAHGNGSVRLDSVLAMLGTLDHRHLHQLLEAVLRQDAPATMAKITEIATLGPDFDQLHAELEGLLHRIAMAQLLPATVQEQGADADALLQLAQAMSPEEVQLCYQIVLGGRKDLPWAPDGRTALEMTCLRMLAFSPRREVLHPASLTALPPAIGGLATEARSGAAAPGKPQGAEPAPAASAAPLAPSAVAAAAPAAPIVPVVMAEPATVEQALERQDNGAELDPLFAEQDELLREAEQMGYEAVTLPAASGNLPAEPSVAPSSVPVMAEPEPESIPQAEVVADAEAVPSTVSSMQSLLGKRNLLRSRLRSEPSVATSAVRTAPAKPVAAARPATAIQSAATPAPAFEPQPARVDGQGQASARPAPQTGYDELPPLDAYEESGSDYEEYLSQGFSDAFASVPLPERAAEALSPAPVPAAVARPQSDDLPPWDLDGSAPRQVSAAPVAAPVTALARSLPASRCLRPR